MNVEGRMTADARRWSLPFDRGSAGWQAEVYVLAVLRRSSFAVAERGTTKRGSRRLTSSLESESESESGLALSLVSRERFNQPHDILFRVVQVRADPEAAVADDGDDAVFGFEVPLQQSQVVGC